MGAIDLDPFSCERANEVVRAAEFWSQSGFENAWAHEGRAARVFCNPPGGKLHPKTLDPCKGRGLSGAAVAWAKLVDEYEKGNVEQAVFVCFNLELFRTSQGFEGVRSVLDFPFCVPRRRLRFWGESTPIGTGDPQHPNAIVYLPRADTSVIKAHAHFREHFQQFGACH